MNPCGRFVSTLLFMMLALSSSPGKSESTRSDRDPVPGFTPVSAETIGLRAPARPGHEVFLPPPQAIVGPGHYDLSLSGDLELGGFVFKEGYPFLHNDGGAALRTTALGINALVSLTPDIPDPSSGDDNTAIGYSALRYTTEGFFNTALGSRALQRNLSGFANIGVGNRALYSNASGHRNVSVGVNSLTYNTIGGQNTAVGSESLMMNIEGAGNTAVGAYALVSNTYGDSNTAFGEFALNANTEGSRSVAIGQGALSANTLGSRNLALGTSAGNQSLTGSDNIWIASYGGDESNTLRIGDGTGVENFQLDRAFIAGIRNASGTFDQSVCTSLDDQLGPCGASSARFKEEIEPMRETSAGLFNLRPVRFRYTPERDSSDSRSVHYGLVAEEVAKIYPSLVTLDAEGRAITVRYEALTPLLLNELHKQRELNAQLTQAVLRVQDRLAELERTTAD